MTDVLKLLPSFKWRGKAYPVTARGVGFAHESATHKLQYRDGDFIEQTGARNLTFRYTVPMREDIAKGPYANLFTVGLPELIRDCRNRVADVLWDPVYGEFRCVPSSYDDETDVTRRDGTDISLEFTHSPELDDAEGFVSTISNSGLVTDAGAMNAELAESQDFEQFEGEMPDTDILSAINGFGAQLERQGNKFSAALDDLAFKCEKIEETADRLENPQNWQIRRSARRVRETAVRLKKRAADPRRRVVEVTRRFAATASAVAAEEGMTLQELLELNPVLARSGIVPSGSVVRRYG